MPKKKTKEKICSVCLGRDGCMCALFPKPEKIVDINKEIEIGIKKVWKDMKIEMFRKGFITGILVSLVVVIISRYL